VLSIFPSLRGYRAAWLPGDLISGVMLATIAIPEQLATAHLAGFPPAAGLIAFAAGSIAFAILGANPYLSVGADSTIAPIFVGALAALAGANSAHYAPLAGFLAIAVGAVLIVAGLARAGWLADLLSVPVTVGFLAGIAVHIVVGQLPALLGLPAVSGPLLENLWHALQNGAHANLFDLGIGLGVVVVALVAKRINAHIPGALIALAGAAAASYVWSFDRHGVQMLGALHVRLGSVGIPAVPDVSDLAMIAPLTLVVAAVCIMQTAAVGRAFAAKVDEAEDVSRSLFAVGAGSVLAGVLGAFPVNSSPPRTAIVKSAGGASQLAGLVGVVAMATVVLVASPLLAAVPQAALAGVLVFIALHIFRLREMRRIAKYSRREFVLLVVGALLVIVFPIQTGMLLAIMLSLAHGIQMMMWPPATELLRVPGTTIWWPASDEPNGARVPGVVVFAPAAPINFTNAEYIHDQMLSAIAHADAPVHLLVIEASGVTDIDFTGSQRAQQSIRELRSRGIDVALARLIATHAQQAAHRSGLITVLGADHIFKSVDEAVRQLSSGTSLG
jgi:MFS superfamily sulfate permease-like transporter